MPYLKFIWAWLSSSFKHVHFVLKAGFALAIKSHGFNPIKMLKFFPVINFSAHNIKLNGIAIFIELIKNGDVKNLMRNLRIQWAKITFQYSLLYYNLYYLFTTLNPAGSKST